MKRKKSRFWLFLFSLFPGAGHMYLGLMRMGLSFMFGFMLSVALMNITGLDVLVVLPLTIYIYSFFMPTTSEAWMTQPLRRWRMNIFWGSAI